MSHTPMGLNGMLLQLRGRSSQVKYTDRVTAACRRSKCQLLRVEGVAWSVQRIPTAVNLGGLDRSRCFFIHVAPQLSSRRTVDPVPDPLLLRKSGMAGNRTRDLWICSHRGGLTSCYRDSFTLQWRTNCPLSGVVTCYLFKVNVT
jgi:hypothetical protein